MDLTVKPPKHLKKYKTKQPPYAHMEGWLPCRCLLTNPSGGGKGIIMLNLALKFWRGCFSRIYLFSPTADVDHTWGPLEQHIRSDLNVDESEQVFFNTFSEKKTRGNSGNPVEDSSMAKEKPAERENPPNINFDRRFWFRSEHHETH